MKKRIRQKRRRRQTLGHRRSMYFVNGRREKIKGQQGEGDKEDKLMKEGRKQR